MLKKSIAIMLAVLTVCAPIYADTIIKRNGEQIKGEIININIKYVILEEGTSKGREWLVTGTRNIELDDILRIYTGNKKITNLLLPYKIQRKTITVEKRRILPGVLICSTGLTILSCVQYVKYREDNNSAKAWIDIDSGKSEYYRNKARTHHLYSYFFGLSAFFGVYLTFSGKEYEIHFLDIY